MRPNLINIVSHRNPTLIMISSLMALALAMAGCGTPKGYKQADKTGEGINTFRNDIVKVKGAVDNSMKALDEVAATASTDPRKAYEGFAKSVDQVEKASETAKKNAEKMQQSGQAYFQQWEAQLASVKNEEIRSMAQQRRAKLQETFSGIKAATESSKQSFPKFLDDLKDLRTALSSDLTAQGLDAAKGIFKNTKASGTEVQKNLDALILELNSVMAAITANRPAPAAK